MTTSAAHHDDHDHGYAHVSPIPQLIGVFLVLIFLTVLTTQTTEWHLGRFEIWVSMGIATVKATLVGAYFMHLRYDKAFNILVFLSAFAFAALFVFFSMMDATAYQPEIKASQQQEAMP